MVGKGGGEGWWGKGVGLPTHRYIRTYIQTNMHTCTSCVAQCIKVVYEKITSTFYCPHSTVYTVSINKYMYVHAVYMHINK